MDIVTDLITKVQQEVQSRYGESIPEFRIGTMARFKNSGVWVGSKIWEYNGKEYGSAWIGNWKVADGTHRVDTFEKKSLKDKKFYKDFSMRMKEINEQIQAEKIEKHKKCRETWLPKFQKADPDFLHEYLVDKGIEKTYGSRVDSNNVMMVPIYDESQFVGVQRIYFDPEENKIVKRFSSGIKIAGSFFPLSSFKDSPIVYVSEGFATACTIQTAYPKIPSICVFNANNIGPAIKTIRKINPSCKVVICADRDPVSNTGEIMARKACKSISSCIYKIPKFAKDNGKWTDFNDLHQFESLKSVQDQLRINQSDFVIIQPLGVMDDNYFYMSSENPQPIKIKGHNHTEKYLYNLVPSYSWWKKNFPKFDPDDELKENPTGVNWIEAGNKLMKNCIDKGRFELSNVRSSGCWEDNGTYYYHNGFSLYDGYKKIDIFSDQLTKHYVMGKACHSLERSSQITEEERSELLELFGTISTKSQQHGFLLLGWLMTAPIAGALPWRPHIWLTGESSQGKSWTMENIMGVILKGFCLRPQGDSTEAGIRQAVGNQSLPLVFDEFETDDIRTSQRTEGVIALARQASTPTDGDIMRGTTGGSAMTFSPNFSLCVSSINVNLSHKQDKNRWTVIEFAKERASNEQFEKVQIIAKKLLDHSFGRKLVSYSFHNVGVYLENFNTIELYLKKKGYKGHFCRQYASLLSGLLLVVHNGAIDKDSLNCYLDKFNFGEFFEQTGDDDPEIFKESLLSSIIRVNNDPMTIAEVINSTNLDNKSCVYQKALMRYGIKAGTDHFFVKRTSNKNLTDLFSTTKWKNNWNIALTRVDGTTNNDNRPVWINGKSSKVIKVPFERWAI